MSDKIISRGFYDVRFLEIPHNIEQSSINSYIDSQIHSIYPGNNGAYEYVYRLYDDEAAIVVFVTKDVLKGYPRTPPIVPVFLLATLRKSIGSDTVFIYQTDVIEKISFQDGKPVRSQIIDPLNLSTYESNSGKWLFINKQDDNFQSVDQSSVLKIPRFSDFHRFKPVSSSKSLSYKGFYILLVILLVLISGISFRYSQMIKQEISEQKRLQIQSMKFDNQKSGIENEIKLISEQIQGLSTEGIKNPYRLLITLYNSVGTKIHIQRLTVQNETFSIECISSDPIQVSDILSKDPKFSDVSIQRIQESEGRFKFSLSGSFDE